MPRKASTATNQLDTARGAQLATKDVAAMLGVEPGTVRRYRASDRAKYAFPEPDGHIGDWPWWYSTTIEEWQRSRPGRGAGAGRPRKVVDA